MVIRHFRALVLLLCTTTLLRASDVADPSTLTLSDRIVIASQLYSAVQMYFGHWKGLPADFDLETEYHHYIEQAVASDDRRTFDLASIEFLAGLRNGHSGFGDKWLREQFGQQIGFYAYPLDDEWVVIRSSLHDLKVGEIITALDGEPFESFYRRNRKYISGSDERWRRSFFEYSYLFPATFTITLNSGRKVSVTRRGEFQWAGSEYKTIETSMRDGIAILRVPAFAPRSFEDSAVEFLKTMGPVKALVLDLRGNHGGSTPGNLTDALMDRPYRWMAESTPATLAVFRAWDMLSEHTEPAWGGDRQKPAHPLYSGPLYILIDGGCFSACEDLVVPFKDNHRAIIVGERSAGSTGQPYSHSFDNGMGFSLSTKREYFPDGSPFEGVGIAPNVEIPNSALDLKAGNDPVMAKAMAMIAEGKK